MLTKHPSRFMHKGAEIRVHGIHPRRDAYSREVFYAIFTGIEGGKMQEAPLSEVEAFPLAETEPEPPPAPGDADAPSAPDTAQP